MKCNSLYDEKKERPVMPKDTQKEECTLLDSGPFNLPSKLDGEMERKLTTTQQSWTFMT